MAALPLTIARGPFLTNQRLMQDAIGMPADRSTPPRRRIARDLYWMVDAPLDIAESPDFADIDAALDTATRSPAHSAWGNLKHSIFSPVVESTEEIARLLLPGGLTDLPLHGSEVVLFVPTVDSAVISPANDWEAVSRACDLVQFFSDPARRISLQPLVGRDGQWQPFEPPPDHPAFRSCRRLSILDRVHVADAQTAALISVARPELHVASLIPVEILGSWQTACSWSRGTETLLPRAGLVELANEHGEGSFLVPWEAIENVVGHRLLRTGHHPSRWLTIGFPNSSELDALEVTRVRDGD